MNTPKRTKLTRIMARLGRVAAALAVLAMLWALAPHTATSQVTPPTPTPTLILLGKQATGNIVYSVAVSADGSLVAAGSNDKNIYLLDCQGRLLGKYATGDRAIPEIINGMGEVYPPMHRWGIQSTMDILCGVNNRLHHKNSGG